ncbi:MAG: alpha/beta fold hydrolase [Anaerolineales bacterium]|nr:alpha/beta fold hydrolase [Anaerolineales bacterium]
MKHKKESGKRKGWQVVLLTPGIILIIYSTLFTPWNTKELTSNPRPAVGYTDAARRIVTLQAQEALQDMNPICMTQFYTHGQKVERSIVFVHGYTQCPRQFSNLGKQFYQQGYNVLIVPLPFHGLTDRMTDVHGRLKAEDLTAYTDEMVDIAQGLGNEVTIAGISAGGVVAAWAAQYRSDIDLAVCISPALGTEQIPTLLTAPVTNILTILPDAFMWWNPTLQADGGSEHAYPRYSRHALAQTFRLGFAIQAAARQNGPAARTILVVINGNDHIINNDMIMNLVNCWTRHGANLEIYEFEPVLQLPHDLIDPEHKDQQIELVYPILIDLFTK